MPMCKYIFNKIYYVKKSMYGYTAPGKCIIAIRKSHGIFNKPLNVYNTEVERVPWTNFYSGK